MKQSPRDVLLPATILALIALLVHLPSLSLDFTGFDDVAYVVNNPNLSQPGGLGRIWFSGDNEQYYPLTFTTFWLENRVWGQSAWAYHLTNTVLHSVNTALVVLLVRGLGGSTWVAVVVGLFFAVHPVQVMSVAWIAERKNLLSCAFTLGTALCWFRMRDQKARCWYAPSLLFYVLALLSKTAVLALPVVLLVADRLRWRVAWRDALPRALPMLGLAVLAIWVTSLFEQKFMLSVPGLEKRALIAPAAWWFYARQLVMPIKLLPLYPLWDVSPVSPRWWLPAAGFVLLAWMVWRLRRTLGGSMALGWSWFTLFLLPSLGLAAYANLALTCVSDHYLYIACIGFFLAGAAALERTWRQSRAGRSAIHAALAAAALASVVRTVTYTRVFQDAMTLWTYTLSGNPDSYAAHAGLGMAYAQERNWREAVVHYGRAVAIEPDEPEPYWGLAEAQLNLGDAAGATATGQKLATVLPDHPQLWVRLGQMAEQTRDIEHAVKHYERALLIDPDYAEAHIALGAVYLGLADRRQAAQHFQQVIASGSGYPTAYLGLATAQRGERRYPEALATLRDGLSHHPDDVPLLNYLARILATCPDERFRNGIKGLEAALRASRLAGDTSYLALETLAAAYAETGRFDDAVSTAQRAAVQAGAANDAAMVQLLRQRAAQYAEGIPLREEPPAAGGE